MRTRWCGLHPSKPYPNPKRLLLCWTSPPPFSDPEPDVRSQAISTLTVLTPTSPALTKLLLPLLDDEHAKVSTRAALSILQSSNL